MDDLNRLLSSDDALTPSSGFEDRVMAAVREAATAPPPLGFPFGRFALGVAASVVWAAACVRLAGAIEVPTVRQLSDAGPELAHAAMVVGLTLLTLGISRLRRLARSD